MSSVHLKPSTPTMPTRARVLSEGGRLSIHLMQTLVQCALDAGLHTMHVDARQTMVFENTHHQSATSAQVSALYRALPKHSLQLAQDDEHNIISSVPSFRVFAQTDWVDAGVYSVLLRELRAIPIKDIQGQTISLIDPKQDLIPLLSSNINFIAAQRADFWYVYVCAAHTDTPLLYPRLIGSASVAAFAQTLAQALARNIHNADDWAQCCATLSAHTQWQQSDFESCSMPSLAVAHYEGIHHYADGHWLGIARASCRFELNALAQLLRLAAAQSIEYLHMSTWGSLLIKKISVASLPQWNWFLNLNHWDEGLSYAHLNWMMPKSSAHLIALHKRVVAALHSHGVRTWGLSFGLIEHREPIAIYPGILITQERARYPLWTRIFGARYRLDCAQQFNPLMGAYQTMGQNLSESELIELLLVTVEQFQKNSGLARPVRIENVGYIAPPLKSESTDLAEDGQEHDCCAVCGTQYIEALGEPRQNIAMNTAFLALPEDFHCPVCCADKSYFVRKTVA